jgi:hypothetical protein
MSPPQTNHIAEPELDDLWLTGGHYSNSRSGV